jgi:hypothetical protein
MPRQLWIADQCRRAGLEVVEVDGWQTRGSETFFPQGVVCHHTAGAKQGDMPSLRTLIDGRNASPGRKALHGPLCQVGLSRSGKVYVIASGRANHAGEGEWRGLDDNAEVFGIEAENVGTAEDPWPARQLAAYYRLAAALMTGPGMSRDADLVCAHREWAPNRKTDPHTLDMDVFRTKVREAVTPAPEREEDDVYVKLGASIYQIVGGKRVKIGTGDPGTRRWAALQAAGVRAVTVPNAQHPLIKEFPEANN